MNRIAARRRLRRAGGFTLVELMIVVAIIGVLAALAIYGVRRYLASAKSGEAKDKLGAIARGATAAFEREITAPQTLAEGSLSVQSAHTLCGSAVAVPATVPSGRKYQPIATPGNDYSSGNMVTGWLCLKFSINQPHYYQYQYTRNGMAAAPSNPAACTSDCFEAGAVGDLDGDGEFGRFARTGQINTTTQKLKASSQIYVENDNE